MRTRSTFTGLAAVIVAFWAQGAAAGTVTLSGVSASAEAQGTEVLLAPGYNNVVVTVPPATLPISAVSNYDNDIEYYPGTSSATTSVTGGSDPTDSVSLSAAGGGLAGGTGQLSFQIEITCLTAGCATSDIPVIVQGNDSLTQHITGSDTAITESTSLTVSDENGTYSNTAAGPIDQTLDFALDTAYDISMFASASVDTDIEGGGSALAEVDPTFTVVPTFADAGDYTIDFSPGLISTTPLPATLPLFLSGLCAMGLIGWRRKRKNAAAIAA